MKGKLRALGLALVALLALGALVAQSAQAVEHTFHSEVERTVLTGGYDPANESKPDEFHIGTATFICTSTKFEGTTVGKTNDQVTLTPTYGSTTKPSGCEAKGTGIEVLVHTNHCAYVFESDTVLTAGTTEEHAPLEIECSGASENEITLTMPSIGVEIHIPAQNTIKDGVTYTNIGEGSKREITAHVTAKGIHGECTGANCFLVGTWKFTNATYEGTETIAGFKDEAAGELTGTEKTTPTAVSLKEGAQVGVFLTTP
ncbi:MAG TPA: hypothetical protein VHI77_09620 [Solirubrobacterales bacterium]|jgi:hypothetical protein|nr:hypothetical protein [Solirubrobacterales bacterium]